MVELRWIKMFLFLILGLQFTAVTGQTPIDIIVIDGDEASLPCGNMLTDRDECHMTDWTFSGLRKTEEELIKLGQIGENVGAKSDRLSVTANCSLVIKKVTAEDTGPYSCRQYNRSGQQISVVFLSVVSMTEHKDTDEVTLSCSVSTYDWCTHTVKWVYNGSDWDINTRDAQTPQSNCMATALLSTSHFVYTANYQDLQCNVTDVNSGKVQLYDFSPQLSDKKPDVNDTPTTKSTIQSNTKAASTNVTPGSGQ